MDATLTEAKAVAYSIREDAYRVEVLNHLGAGLTLANRNSGANAILSEAIETMRAAIRAAQEAALIAFRGRQQG